MTKGSPGEQTSSMSDCQRAGQEKRSARTRDILFAAAVEVLYREGYAAATTLRISEVAKVSRGRMLHHFPTRASMLIYVVERVFEQEMVDYTKIFRGINGAEARILALPEVVWSMLSRPSGMAVLEVLQGSRSDPAIEAELSPVQRQIEANVIVFLQAWLEWDLDSARALMRLVVWSIRGLSIAGVLMPEREAREAVAMLSVLMRQTLGNAEARAVALGLWEKSGLRQQNP